MGSIEFLAGMGRSQAKRQATLAAREKEAEDLKIQKAKISLDQAIEKRRAADEEAERKIKREEIQREIIQNEIGNKRTDRFLRRPGFGEQPQQGQALEPRGNVPQAFVPGPGQEQAQSRLPGIPPQGQVTPGGELAPGHKIGISGGKLTASITGQALPSVGTDAQRVSEALFGMRLRDPRMTKTMKAEVDRTVTANRLEAKRQEGAAAFAAKTSQELRTQRADRLKVIDAIGGIQDLIENDPAILATPGALARAFVNVIDSAKSIVKLFVPKAKFESLNKVSLYSETFKGTAVTSSVLKSALLGAAISVAAAEGFTGRAVTKFRIETILDRLIGAVSGSPEVALGTLEAFKKEMAEAFNTALTAQQQPLKAIQLKPQKFKKSAELSVTKPVTSTQPEFQFLSEKPIPNP